MLAISKMTNVTEKVQIYGLMAMYMKETGKIIKNMAKEF